MSQPTWSQEPTVLEPRLDPVTGDLVYAADDTAPAPALTLPKETFAGDPQGPVDWRTVEEKQDHGGMVTLVNGELVTEYGGPTTGVPLPKDTFAAPSLDGEVREVRALAAQRVGAQLVEELRHTSQIPGYSKASPQGWSLVTRPTRLGDRLRVVIARNSSTNLYHSHLWRYELRQSDGSYGVVDVPAYLGRHRNLTNHTTHLYSSGNSDGVLCLSTRTQGGMVSLTDAILQCHKWADGIGEVLRGRPFPYRQ